MYVAFSVDFDDLFEYSNSASESNFQIMQDYGLQDRFMSLLKYRYGEKIPTREEINNFVENLDTWILRNIYVSNVEDLQDLLNWYQINYSIEEVNNIPKSAYDIMSVLDIIAKYFEGQFEPNWDFIESEVNK